MIVRTRSWLLRLAKVSPLAVLVLLAFYFGYTEYFAPRSHQAMLVADVVPLRSPIDGFVSLSVKAGQNVSASEAVAVVEDPTPDLGLILNARLQKARIEHELDATEGVRNGVKRVLAKQGGRDAAARAALVEWKKDEASQVDDLLQTLEAARDHAERALQRESRLLAEGVGQQQAYESAALALQRATSDLHAAQTETGRKKLELASAKLGQVLGSGEGTPFAGGQAERLEIERLGVERELAVLNATHSELNGQLKELEQRLTLASKRVLAVPAATRIWALSVATGSFVRKGDVVMEIAACSTLRVKAFVGERLYESLRAGTHATVELLGSKYAAEVETLLGPVFSSASAVRAFSPLGRLERKDHNLGVVLRVKSTLPKEACSSLSAVASVGFDT